MIKDRVKELRKVRAKDLIANPKNWRTHSEQQKLAMTAVLKEVGYADALLARELDDGRLILIDGHLRADTTPDQIVPVLVLDVTADEADKLLATIDPLAAMAGTDGKALTDLVGSIKADVPEFRDLLKHIDSPVELRPIHDIYDQAPPAMSWVLIGIPTTRYNEISDTIDAIALRPHVICETTTTNPVT